MKDVVCQRCGSVNDYRTEQSGPHIKAICRSCDRYIKFLKQSEESEDYQRGFAEGYAQAIRDSQSGHGPS